MSDNKKPAKIALAVLLPLAAIVIAWQFIGSNGDPPKDTAAEAKAAAIKKEYADDAATKPPAPPEPEPTAPPSRSPRKK